MKRGVLSICIFLSVILATFFVLNLPQTPSPLPIHTLRFDGHALVLLDPSGMALKRYSAKAGRPWTTSQDQFLKNKGPLPEGTYWVKQEGHVSLFHSQSWREAVGWVMRCFGWGVESVVLLPFSENDLRGRHRYWIVGSRCLRKV